MQERKLGMYHKLGTKCTAAIRAFKLIFKYQGIRIIWKKWFIFVSKLNTQGKFWNYSLFNEIEWFSNNDKPIVRILDLF